jgi:hypothetical protein
MGFDSIDAIERWIVENIDYVSDIELYGHVQQWSNPSDIIKMGKGDCEDMAIVYLWMVYANLGIEGELVILENPRTKEQHAEARVLSKRFYTIPDFDYRLVSYSMGEVSRLFGFYNKNILVK